MHIHILGICGTFMGGIAVIARELGHTVTGSDQNVYPPMSTQLQEQGIDLYQGYDRRNLEPMPDLVIVGNALSRGNPELEAVLDNGIRYTSGAQWLAEHVLYDERWVLAVSGTHGKTTTTSMLAWILEYAGMAPGFLIGGVARNFDTSARIGNTPFFVIEADEYDTAFFDKRSKFIHYRPRTAILNNLEFDHADIFEDLDSIKRQFHHFIRTVPGSGLLVVNAVDFNLKDVLSQGCWTPINYFGEVSGWLAEPMNEQCESFRVIIEGECVGEVSWELAGEYNMLNGLAAMAAARHAGVSPKVASAALSEFQGVKRRLEVRGTIGGITVYDDFAHHPTAINATLKALRAKIGRQRLIAVVEPRSNTMRMGSHKEILAESLSEADSVYLVPTAELSWDLDAVARQLGSKAQIIPAVDKTVSVLQNNLKKHDHVVIMSNGGFGDIHNKLLSALELSLSHGIAER